MPDTAAHPSFVKILSLGSRMPFYGLFFIMPFFFFLNKSLCILGIKTRISFGPAIELLGSKSIEIKIPGGNDIYLGTSIVGKTNVNKK